jgi:cytochrome c oxidase cbb3-type subunit 4
MDTYSILRQFADSWGLLGLFLVFVGVVVYAYRPGAKAVHDDTAQIPFRNDEFPGE